MDIFGLQQLLPARVKFALKPYYRKVFPNRLHMYWNPTFRCNYKCSYCPVVTKFAYTTVVGKSQERTGVEWLSAFDRLPPFVLYIAGGEPFVYADLAIVVNEFPAKHQLMGIVTNLSQPGSVYRKIKKSIHLNASFHREHTNDEEFIAKIRELRDQFHINVNIVATPENLPLLRKISDEFSPYGIPLHVDPYIDLGFQYTEDQLKSLKPFLAPDRKHDNELDFTDFSPKRCSAGRNYINVAPDGGAYTCNGGMNFIHSPLYSELSAGRDVSQYRMGNIFDPDFHSNQKDIACSMPCNLACDRDTAIIRPA
jgi:MoaA/NifB/PqqE/SkfB family radical SAM enzyme